MKSFISVLGLALSILSLDSSVTAVPMDTSSDHLEVARDLTGQYVSYLSPVYGDSKSDQPAGTMKEINGKSNDINSGFGGKYVWIEVDRNDDMRLAWDTVHVFHGNCVAFTLLGNRIQDLAKGAGGDCRWLDLIKGSRAMTDAALWRAPSATTNPPQGWSYITKDINEGRGGDYLYIVWNSISK